MDAEDWPPIPQLERRAARAADRVMAALPPDLREAARECAVTFMPVPDPAMEEDGVDPTLLGLFEGSSRLEPEPASHPESPRITLFLDNLWDEAGGDWRRFDEETRITLLHELGHYLGLDEDQVKALGLE